MQRINEFNKRQANYKKEREEQELTHERIYHEQVIEEVNKLDSYWRIDNLVENSIMWKRIFFVRTYFDATVGQKRGQTSWREETAIVDQTTRLRYQS